MPVDNQGLRWPPVTPRGWQHVTSGWERWFPGSLVSSCPPHSTLQLRLAVPLWKSA